MSNKLTQQIKKAITVGVSATTIMWSVGFAAIPVTFGATSGDLIKTSASASVYYLGANSKRYVFPNDKGYFTWYSNFSGVKTISQTELESYPIGGNVTYKPGAKMVKITTDPKVYAVGMNGTLRWIKSEAIAKALYGDMWNKQIDDVPDAFFVNYTIGSEIADAAQFDKTAEMTKATNINADKGLGGGGGPTVSGSTLTVSLAADTPAAGIVVQSAARVPFTKINLTASSDGDVTVDTWLIERAGLAQDAGFASVDIVDGSTNLPIGDVAKNFTSEHTANFTEDVVVKAGTTKVMWLVGNMAAALTNYAGETPALALKALTLKGGATVIGTLPIVGNYQTLNNTISIGTATIQRGAYTNATNTALEVGKMAYTFFSFQIQAGSVEEVQFSQIKVYQQGSGSMKDDLANLKLYKDNTEVATGSVNGIYATFNFPVVTLTKGQTVQFQVKADLVSGSARTIDLGIFRTTDLLVKGTTYGYNITPTYSGTGSSANNPVLSDNTFTISAGTLRVSRSNTVGANNITIGSNQTIGAFEFEAKGESVTVTALTLTITSTSPAALTALAFRSVRLVDANGTSVAGPTDSANGVRTVAFSNSFTIPTGVHIYKVVGNLDTSAGWATNNTIRADIDTPASAITARGDVTNLTISATPSALVSTATQTIKTANMTVSKNSDPANKSVIINATNVLAGSWTFDATNSGEDIRMTSLAVRASTTGKLNNLTLKDGATILQPVNAAPTAAALATSTFAFSDPVIIKKGTVKVINLYVDIGSNALAGEVDAYAVNSGPGVVAYGVTTGNAATITTVENNGALLTIAASGTLTIDNDSSISPSRLVVGGSSMVPLAGVRLKATNEDIDITQLIITVVNGAASTVGNASSPILGTGTGSFAQVSKFYLKLDGAVIGAAGGYNTGAASLTVTLGRGDLTIPSGAVGKKLDVLADLVPIGTNEAGTENVSIAVGLGSTGQDAFTATGNGSNATVSAANKTYNSSTGSTVAIHKAVPQVVKGTVTEKLGATAVLHRTNITAVGGNIGLFRLSYITQSSASVNLASLYTTLKSCTGCGGISDGSQLANTVTAGTDIASGIKSWNMAISSTQSHGKSYLSIAKDMTAIIDLQGTITLTTNADTVTTTLLGDTSSAQSGDLTGQPTAAWTIHNQGNFVWSSLNNTEANSSSGLTSKQWFNGYYVSGLGAVATTSVAITVGE